VWEVYGRTPSNILCDTTKEFIHNPQAPLWRMIYGLIYAITLISTTLFAVIRSHPNRFQDELPVLWAVIFNLVLCCCILFTFSLDGLFVLTYLNIFLGFVEMFALVVMLFAQ
jgi:hypothetical protein